MYVQSTSSSTVSRASFKFNSRGEEDFEWSKDRNKSCLVFFRKVSSLFLLFKGKKIPIYVQPTSSSTVSRASFNSRGEEDFEWSKDRNKLFFRKVFPLSFFFSKRRKFLCMFTRRAVQQFRALVLILERRRFRMIERS